MLTREVRLPPVSDALARLLSLSEKDRLNLKILELLAHKDVPAATRLLALANSPLYSRGREYRTLTEAIVRLGAVTTYDALLGVWVVQSVSTAPEVCPRLRNSLTRVFISHCITLRRVIEAYEDPAVSLVACQVEGVLLMAPQLLALSLPENALEAEALNTSVSGPWPRLIVAPPAPELTQTFALDLGRYWGVSEGALTEIGRWLDADEPSNAIAMNIVTELMLFAIKAGFCEYETFVGLLDKFPKAQRIVEKLHSKKVVLKSLIVAY